eukprot:TRINITY_DN43041_c0_g1_i1.p1 TRINITY_DN43041_c0_g1~~TRINITY_DN43041_c0_g1_i1.p1  ORF type:complete len:163 (-),score=15.56 TRINITY_DN43041_c0_g1_i1:111-599(-)
MDKPHRDNPSTDSLDDATAGEPEPLGQTAHTGDDNTGMTTPDLHQNSSETRQTNAPKSRRKLKELFRSHHGISTNVTPETFTDHQDGNPAVTSKERKRDKLAKVFKLKRGEEKNQKKEETNTTTSNSDVCWDRPVIYGSGDNRYMRVQSFSYGFCGSRYVRV